MTVDERRFCSRLNDERGASIVIALVFFLICGIIGSVVVTAASVQAKATQTHIDLQQDEFAMQSAAEMVSKMLGGDANAFRIDYDAKGNPQVDIEKAAPQLGKVVWTQDHIEKVLTARSSTVGEAFSIEGTDAQPFSIDLEQWGNSLARTIYCRIAVDTDFNVTIRLSFDASLASGDSYDMTVFVQSIPTYDLDGRITKVDFEPAVIEKTSGVSS